VVILEYSYVGAVVNASMSNSLGICPGGSVTLSASNVPTYTWSTGPSNTSIVVSPTTTTSYTVAGTNTLGCISNAVLTVSINPLPAITAVSNKTLYCVGENAVLTASGALTYTWNNAATGSTTNVNPTSTIVYTVTGTSTAGCINTQTVTANVDSNSLTVTPDTAVCEGKSIIIMVSGGNTYTWSTNSPFGSITVSPSTPTFYIVNATDIYNCHLSNTVNVNVHPTPVVIATANRTLVCKGEPVVLSAGGASTYSWTSIGSGASLTVTPPLDITYVYTVTGTSPYGCFSTSSVTVKAGACTGITTMGKTGNIKIYPNPSNGEFLIECGTDTELRVINEIGQVFSNVTLNSANNYQAKVTGLPQGIYFVTSMDKNGPIRQKVIVTK
jgi:hypothetical protein